MESVRVNLFRKAAIPVLAVLVALFTKCGMQGELGLLPEQPEHLFLVRVLGVDKSSLGEGLLRITMEGSGPTLAVGPGEPASGKVPYIISMDGHSVYDISQRIDTTSDLDIHWGHISFLVVGEDIAKEDINKCIDMMMREHEARTSIIIFVAYGSTAEEMIKKSNTSGFLFHERLEQLVQMAGEYSVSAKVPLYRFADMLSSDTCAAYAPCLIPAEYVYNTAEMDKDKQGINLNGFAVFKDGRLAGYMLNEVARGFNFAIGKVKSTSIVVKDTLGSNVTLEVINSQANIKPLITDGKPSVTLEVSFQTNIADLQSTRSIFTERELDRLRLAQEEEVKKEVQSAVNYCKSLDADILDFLGAFHRTCTVEWEKMRGDWDRIFPALDVNIIIRSEIKRTYTIREPAGGKE
ncbi:MAG: Ger(x)C family spore germination protein [Bacillota bacterium]|nr:Ger(x)C family spore germination protein [Bacillota bacterium]